MGQYNFTSPAASFSDAMSQELLRREMQKRQDMLDALKAQELKSVQADRISNRSLQASQQALMEKMNQQGQDEKQREFDARQAAIAGPQPGMVGNVPDQFAQPMEQPGDASGIETKAPTQGGSIYLENRQAAAEKQQLEDARLKATADDREAQRTNQNQQNELQRGMQLAIAHLAHSNNESSRALADELKRMTIAKEQDALDTKRSDRAKAETSAANDRQSVYSVASDLMNDPSLSAVVGGFDARTPTFREGSKDVEARVARLKSLLSLENRSKMKGQGAVSDFEGRMLEAAATSLNPAAGEAAFKKELQRIMDATKSGGSSAGGATLPAGVTVTRVK
jgi:hypothetical protein